MNGFDGLSWYRSIETVNKKEGERVLKATLFVVGAGAVEWAGIKAKRTGVFVEALRYRRRFLKVDWISVDKLKIRM